MRRLLLSVAFLAVASASSAQELERYSELLRQDVRTKKVFVITKAMMLTDEQSDAFWPLYREYDLAQAELDDKRLALIKDYAKAFQGMDEDKAKDLLSRAMKLREEQSKLQGKYVKRMQKELGPVVAARFWQVDTQMQDLIDLQIAANLPIMPKAGDTVSAGGD